MRVYTAIIVLSVLFSSWGDSPVYAQGLFSPIDEKEKSGGIRASLLPDGKSVYLLWEPGTDDGEVIVARSNSIIDTPEKLYVADSLGRLPARERNSVSNYYDYNLKPGSYFYAVVPVSDVRQRRVRMIPGQNFTTEPMIVEKASPVNTTQKLIPDTSTGKSKSVGAILVKAEGNNIRVNWVPSWNAIPGKTIYSIYRSSSPLSTMEEMREADKLAELPHPINTYLDQNISKSQTLFYGVSIKDENTEEQIPLERGKSFVRIFFIRTKDGRTEAVRDSEPASVTKEEERSGDVVSNFQVKGFGYTRDGKGAILQWNPPTNADDTTQYTIYASTGDFNRGVNSFVGGGVLKVGTLSHPKTSLLIREIKRVDNLYFAITAKKANVPENFEMEIGETTFRYEFDRDIDPNESKSIVQDSKENSSNQATDSKNIDVAKTDPSRTQRLGDNDVDSKKNESQSGDEKSESVSSEKVTKNNENIQEIIGVGNDKQLLKILQSTYAKKDYNAAILFLNRYIARETNPELLGMARFYLGVSYYRQGKYRLALDEFLRRETMNYNQNRTVFWKNQTLAKLGRGGL